jgi:hypothetical protein
MDECHWITDIDPMAFRSRSFQTLESQEQDRQGERPGLSVSLPGESMHSQSAGGLHLLSISRPLVKKFQ